MTDNRGRLDAATSHLDPPLAVIDLSAFQANAADLVRRAGGKSIRVASKSVRCRALLADVLAREGFAGVLAFTLAEGLWLAGFGEPFHDVLIAYPSVDRTALRRLVDESELTNRVTLMVDSVDHLDLIDAVAPPGHRPPVRICLDVDASLRLIRGNLHIGVRRSPVHTPHHAAELARTVRDRPGFHLVGLMAYEAQIAGLGDAPPGRPVRALAIRALQRRSAAELAERRAAVVDAVTSVFDEPLDFVNGGGTGSIERTAAEDAVTEVAAGSGLYGPVLFDAYRAFSPRPAALFALPVTRRPAPGFVTVHGGGWIASGPAGRDRLPVPVYPAGLRLVGTEGAGEVQTPLHGRAAHRLQIGDRVWFRHAKAGEMCEHVDVLHVIEETASRPIRTVMTYRGEGKVF